MTSDSPAGTASTGTGRTRTTRPVLSRSLIVARTLELVDREGLAKLSMRRLGAELGADPMAVYHYFPSKSALFDAVVEAVYSQVELPTFAEDTPWPDVMRGLARAHRAALRRHPAALPVIATRPSFTPDSLRFIESSLAALVARGASLADALDVLNCVGVYTIGHVLAEVGEPFGAPETEANDPSSMDWSSLPTLAAAFMGGWDYEPDRQYEMGLDALVIGLGARLGLHD